MPLACTGGIRTADVNLEEKEDQTQVEKQPQRIHIDGEETVWLKRESLRKGLKDEGYEKWSPVQSQALPLATCGIDLIVEAKSGTGKTLVFAITALEMISVTGFCQILVLAPTREIAVQIADVFRSIGKHIEGLNVGVFIGGTDIRSETKRLQSQTHHVIVGSPGRIKHFIKDGILNVGFVRLFILDEADKLLEESFQNDINFIYNRLPEHKQVIATSATYTETLKNLLLRYMKMPAHIKPHSNAVLLGITQYVAFSDHHPHPQKLSEIKLNKLLDILRHESFKQCLIFCNYQTRARLVYKILKQNDWPVNCLSSSQVQNDRIESLRRLQNFDCRVLVATDLAARGLDAHNVDLVINLDVPQDSATYLHRLGRCGRYGSLGKGITIISSEEKVAFDNLLGSIIDNCNIKTWSLPNGTNKIISFGASKTTAENDAKINNAQWKSFEELKELFAKYADESFEDYFNEENCNLNAYLKNTIETQKLQLNDIINLEKNYEIDLNDFNSSPNKSKMRKPKKKHKNQDNPPEFVQYKSSNRATEDDYYGWRLQLSNRVNQIQKSLYISTLISLYNENDLM